MKKVSIKQVREKLRCKFDRYAIRKDPKGWLCLCLGHYAKHQPIWLLFICSY